MCEDYFQYLPISESNMEWDLYITGTGVAEIAPGENYPPEGHPGTYDFKSKTGRVLPEYQLVFIEEGQGEFRSADMGTVNVKAGDVILLFPGQWHSYHPDEKIGWKERWISWNGEYLYRLTRRGHISTEEAVLALDDDHEITSLYRRILDIVQEHPAENSRVLAAIGMEILATVIESGGNTPLRLDERQLQKKHDVEDKIVVEALQLIWSGSYRISTVDNLVDRLPVTRRTLERRFRAAFGRTIAQEITRSRVARAKHLLANTGLPIEHVALAVGFTDAVHIGKTFQRWEKTTPSAFRKKHSKVQWKGNA